MIATYIELVGVAGSGKTTIANILLDEARRRSVSICSRGVVGKNLWLRVQIVFTILKIVLSVPEILFLYLARTRRAYAHTPHIRRVRYNLVTRMIIDTAVVRCLQRQSSGYLVNDEGLLGKLVSLSVLTDISILKTKSLVNKLLPTPAILVSVTVPPLVALKREQKRDIQLPFFNKMSEDLKEIFFRETADMYTAYVEPAFLIPSVQIVSINNIGTYNDLAREVVSIVKKLKAVILASQYGC